ncbi:MAG: c-type cytochrome [Bauldia sp.]
MLATATLAQVIAPPANVMSAGQAGYNDNCRVCHGANGEGGAGFALDGNPVAQSEGGVVSMILQGYAEHGMPPFRHLSDDVIAAIATYVRNSWSNSYGLVGPGVVAALRTLGE